MHDQRLTHIIIAGAGAGGLELAIRLIRKFGQGNIQVSLVDPSLKYVWKPLYHEVAVGTLDYAENEVNYIAYSYRKGIQFLVGSLCGVNRTEKKVTIAPVYDHDQNLVLPERTLSYDYLVIAIGSVSNTFNIPGVEEHCFFLDKLNQAERFQRDFLFRIIRFIQTKDNSRALRVSIVGGGATGVELAAELRYALSQAIVYGSRSMELLQNLKIVIVEGADRILPNLLPIISEKVTHQLHGMNIEVLTGERVICATTKGLETQKGTVIESDGTLVAQPASIRPAAIAIKPVFIIHFPLYF